MKKSIAIIFFLFVIIDITGEYYKFTNLALLMRILTTPIAYLGYLYFREFKIERIGTLLLASIFFTCLGLVATHLLPYGDNYMETTLIIYICEAQIQIFIITNFFYIKNKSMKDEFIKLITIFSVGIIFIYFFFPMFNFWAQLTVFIRVLQFSFFFAYTYKNKLLNWQILWSIWTLLFSNILSVVFLFITPSQIFHVFVMASLFASKFLFVNGLIESLKSKRAKILEL